MKRGGGGGGSGWIRGFFFVLFFFGSGRFFFFFYGWKGRGGGGSEFAQGRVHQSALFLAHTNLAQATGCDPCVGFCFFFFLARANGGALRDETRRLHHCHAPR